VGFFYVLSGEQGVSKAFLEQWKICDGYMDVSDVAVFLWQYKYTSRKSILSLSGRGSVSSCEIMLRVAGMKMEDCVCDVTAQVQQPIRLWVSSV